MRDAQFHIICGTNGTGKSTLVDKILQATHYKNALVYLESIDLNGNPFKGLPRLQKPSEYVNGKAVIDSEVLSFDKFIYGVARNFRNGLLIIDEAGLYSMFDKKTNEPIEGVKLLMKQRRKYNVEIYFIYHGISEIPVKFFKWANNLILFHQTDEFKHKSAVIPRVHELVIVADRIRAQFLKGNRHYCEVFRLS